MVHAVAAPGPLATLLSVAAVVAHVAICVAAACVIPGGRRPSTGMAWLLLILATPFVGMLFFLLFGSTHVERRRQAKQQRVNEQIHERTASVAELREDTPRLAYVASAARLNRRLGALPAVGGNSIEFLPDYRASIAAMADAVHAASEYVHVEFYILAWDEVTEPFFDALVAATEDAARRRYLLSLSADSIRSVSAAAAESGTSLSRFSTGATTWVSGWVTNCPTAMIRCRRAFGCRMYAAAAS